MVIPVKKDLNWLRKTLEKLGQADRYSIRDTNQDDVRPDDTTVLEPEKEIKGWCMYYTDKGQVFDKIHFGTEAEAIEAVYKHAARPVPMLHKSTEKEREEAKQLALERERKFRIARGLDPETGKPVEKK
jgi:hypothetical protein